MPHSIHRLNRTVCCVLLICLWLLTPSCLAHVDNSLENASLDDALKPETQIEPFPRRSDERLPSKMVAALFLWLAGQPGSPGDTDSATSAASPYALTPQEAKNLNLTVTIEEARGEHLAAVRQFQVQNLKEVSEFIGSPDFVEIGDLIGYPEGYEPGMSLADIQADYVQGIREELQTANAELIAIYKQAITYQIFGLIDMLEKARFGPETIEPGFLTTALADLASLRVEIIDLERSRAGLPPPAVARRAYDGNSLGGFIGGIGGAAVINEIANSIERANIKSQNEAMFKDLLPTLFVRENVRSQFGQMCGCALKAHQPAPALNGVRELPEFERFKSPINPSTDLDILASPNQFNNVMLGDSITNVGGNWNYYTPGFGIVNGGISSATSQDVSEWLDFCASQNPELWSRSHNQDPGCVSGSGGGRFACNPAPGRSQSRIDFASTSVETADRFSGYVQFQNRNVYLMVGGNDFNIELYKSQLQTLPFLIPFRHMHVGNQVNKIISYIQYQAGTRVILTGYMPLPSYFPGDEFDNPLFNLTESLNRLGLHSRFADWFIEEDDQTSTVKARFEDLPGSRFIVASEQLLRNAMTDALRGQQLSGQVLFDCLAILRPLEILNDQVGFCNAIRGDQSWLSQRLIELNAVFASVAQARQASMYSLYFSFLDYSQSARGCWYCGNRALWSLDPFVTDMEAALASGIPIPNNSSIVRSLNDSIHPNELGYFAYGATLNSIMLQENAHVKQTPFAHNDGCFIEPVDPAPFEACKAVGSTFRFIDGQCVDTAPPPPGSGVGAPELVGNPNGPPTDRPDAATTNPTVEPPPLPGLSDDSLLLIALCYAFGVCSF